MTRETLLMVLGAFVLIAPWSGLPLAWLEWILPILGLAIAGIAFTLRNRGRAPARQMPIEPPAGEREEHPEPRLRSSHIAFS